MIGGAQADVNDGAVGGVDEQVPEVIPVAFLAAETCMSSASAGSEAVHPPEVPRAPGVWFDPDRRRRRRWLRVKLL